jgi:magnesium transporter
MEDFKRTLKALKLALDEDSLNLLSILSNLRPPEICNLMDHLNREDSIRILRELDTSVASDVLACMEEPVRRKLLADLNTKEISEYVSDMESDDAADLLSDIADESVEEILTLIDHQDSVEVRDLMKYPEDTAGGIMATEIIVVHRSATASEVIDLLRNEFNEEELASYHNIYIVDDEYKLVGTLPLQRLLVVSPDVPISEIMDLELLTVNPDVDQEEVAKIFSDYDLLSLPVVNEQGILMGRITVDDIIDVFEDESMEDIAALAGTDAEEIHEPSILRISGLRLPWLVLGLMGGIASAIVMHQFEASFKVLLALSFFVPVITAMGGSAGLQTSTTLVQSMAAGKLRPTQIFKRLTREWAITIINAILLALLLLTVITFWFGNYRLGIAVCAALVAVILAAATFGTIIPMTLKRVGIDPAISLGPFMTTLNDILGVLVYLAVVTSLLTWINS